MRYFGKCYLGCLTVMAVMLVGCERVPEYSTSAPPGTAKAIPEDTTYGQTSNGVHVVRDADTGCQYLGYEGHGLTPRNHKVDGFIVQMGCK